MFSHRLRERDISADFKEVGYICRRCLTFDKVSEDGSGKCDIEQTPNLSDIVYGVAFNISNKDGRKLDKAEGCGKGYCKEWVEVICSSGSLQAVAYVATKKDPALLPYHWYKALVIAGAVEHNLPDFYVKHLRTIDSKEDPDVMRRTKKEALLSD